MEPDLVKLIQNLNRTVDETTKGERFITFFMSVFDPVTRELTYVNAGHNPPLLKDQGAITYLSKGCMGLGMVEQISHIDRTKLKIGVDAVLLCFTDGLIEVENDAGIEYGEERLEKLMFQEDLSSMEALNRAIKKDFDQFRGNNPPHDDFAVLSARFL